MSSAICIFVHVHYPDVWAFIARRLEQSLRVPFRLVVTTTCGRERIAAPGSAHCQDFHIEEVANRGRDILPFLAALEAAPAFDVGLKLHTKKSPHRADGKAWGRAMVESLVGDGEKVARTVAAMRANPQIGLIAPDGLLLPLAPRLGGNLKMMRAIARDPAIAPAPDLRLSALSRARMAAGSMFWFRREAVSGLLTPAHRAPCSPRRTDSATPPRPMPWSGCSHWWRRRADIPSFPPTASNNAPA